MTITSYDGIINARANGGADDPIYLKTTSITPAAAGNWLSLLRSAGSPGPIVASGGNNGALMDQTNQGAIPLVSPADDKKYILRVNANVSNVSGFAALLLVDVVWLANYSLGSSPGAITMDALDRYVSGEGLQIGCAVYETLSAITPTVTVTYNPATGDTGSGHTATTGAFAASLASPKMMPLTTPNMPLAAGDSGVTSITNVAISATGTGSIDLFLYKPICMIPNLNANTPSIWDGFSEIEKNDDDLSGCLGFLALSGGTSACANQMAMLRTVNG